MTDKFVRERLLNFTCSDFEYNTDTNNCFFKFHLLMTKISLRIENEFPCAPKTVHVAGNVLTKSILKEDRKRKDQYTLKKPSANH